MESCKCETAAKGGWTQQEDRLLLSAAQSARRSMRMVTAVHRIHGTASSFMCSQVDSFTAEMYAAQDACPVQS